MSDEAKRVHQVRYASAVERYQAAILDEERKRLFAGEMAKAHANATHEAVQAWNAMRGEMYELAKCLEEGSEGA